jgi:ATP phosphoribosyltransferase
MTLRLAIPSKGRLKDQCEAFLADAGLRIERPGGSRSYAAMLAGARDVEVQLLSASEIAAAVVQGETHLGVTGEDLLHEAAPSLDAFAHCLLPLGFGHARLVVAAPKSWLDVETMEDVDAVGAVMEARASRPLRVATKYVRQTRGFFAEKGVTHYRIVESAGATEGAPAAGVAELVVDITTSGATLESNNLKVLHDGLILASQANLVASLKAGWSQDSLGSLRGLLDVLLARRRARGLRRLRFRTGFNLSVLPAAMAGAVEPIGAGEGLCPADLAGEIARRVAAAGGGPVLQDAPDFVFDDRNPPYEAFEALTNFRQRPT